MRNVWALAGRELLSLFCSAMAYVVLCGFLLITGVLALVTGTFSPGQPATLVNVFRFTPLVLAFIVPAITMRTISEEYRTGTIEPLMTTPVSDTQVVAGKYLGTLLFYVVLLASTLAYVAIMMVFGSPDLGAMAAAYVGLLLVGMAFLAVGMFASALSRNQIVAWMIAAIPLMVFVWFAGVLSQRTEGQWRDALRTVDIGWHSQRFLTGQVTSESVVFFLAVAAYFLFLAIKVVESRRWR